MKKKIFTFVLGGMLFSLSGCYTHICPTYSVNPDQKIDMKAGHKQLEDRMEKASWKLLKQGMNEQPVGCFFYFIAVG